MKGESVRFKNENPTKFTPQEYLTASSCYCKQGILVRQCLGRESKEKARLIKDGKIKEACNHRDGYKIVKCFRFRYQDDYRFSY